MLGFWDPARHCAGTDAVGGATTSISIARLIQKCSAPPERRCVIYKEAEEDRRMIHDSQSVATALVAMGGVFTILADKTGAALTRLFDTLGIRRNRLAHLSRTHPAGGRNGGDTGRSPALGRIAARRGMAEGGLRRDHRRQ